MDEFKDFENNNDAGTSSQQPVTPSYVSPSPTNEGGKGLAVASMVLGIIAIVLCCCLWYISIPCGIVGLILGIVSVQQKKPGAGMAKAGIILSAISVGLAIILGIAIVAGLSLGILDELLNM